MIASFTPHVSPVRDQLYAELLRLGPLVNIRALDRSPQGYLLGTRGDVVFDRRNAALWMKSTGTPGTQGTRTGWVRLSGGGADTAEFGSVGWDTEFLAPAVTQTGSGDALVDVLGTSSLDPPVEFSSPADNQLQYDGTGGTFFVLADINVRNNNAEEAPYGFQLMLNGVAIAESRRTLIMTANAFIPVTTHAQVELVAGDILSAQVGSLAEGNVDTDASYFRLQAQRVGPIA
jgi:hypothetical protein